MHVQSANRNYPPLRIGASALLGLGAGLAGGLAEVGWIWLYSGLSGDDPAAIAAAVTATFFPLTGPVAVLSGLVIHMVLAAALGAALAIGLRGLGPRLASRGGDLWAVTLALALVWGVNFFILLPILNPGFVHIVPLPVSLISKLSFGLAAALVLHRKSRVSQFPAN